MAAYRITLADDHVELVADADAYQQEGPMTTFFRTGADRQVVDSWSVRVASFRTTEIRVVRREDHAQVGSKRYSEAFS